MEKCIARPREILYWPNINSHIKQMIGECQHSTQHRNQLPAETQLKDEIPVTLWTKVATDIFYLDNMSYIIMTDYTIIQLLKNCESITVIKWMKYTFTTFGVPQIVISDNGSEYKSVKFKQFANDWDFKHNYKPKLSSSKWISREKHTNY